MECNCEPVLCFLRRLLKFLQPPSLPRGESWESLCLNCPYPKEEKRDRKAKPVPFPSNQNQQAGPVKTKCHLSFQSPLVRIAAAPPLLREGSNVPSVSSRACGCPPLSWLRDTRCFPTSGHVSFPDQGRWHNALTSPGSGWQGRHSFGIWNLIQVCNTETGVWDFFQDKLSWYVSFFSP